MKPKELKKILKKLGWTEEHGGEHDKMVSPDGEKRVAISRNHKTDIPIGTLCQLEKLTGVRFRK